MKAALIVTAALAALTILVLSAFGTLELLTQYVSEQHGIMDQP